MGGEKGVYNIWYINGGGRKEEGELEVFGSHTTVGWPPYQDMHGPWFIILCVVIWCLCLSTHH